MIGEISSVVKLQESDQEKRGTTEDNTRRVDSHVYARSNTRMLLGLL